MIVVRATERGWQERRLGLAEGRADFLIRDISFGSVISLFCLCRSHEYSALDATDGVLSTPLFKN